MNTLAITGHQTVDAQHSKLFEAIDELTVAVAQHNVTPASIEVLHSFVLTYATTHFNYEEELMRQHSYPDIDSHIAMHRKFSDDMAKVFQLGNVETDLKRALGVLLSLNSWFLNHVRVVDVAMMAHVLQSPTKVIHQEPV